MAETLRVALAQINPTVGDLAGNKNMIIEAIQKAEAEGADMVTFPELAVCGYPPEDLLLKEGFTEDAAAAAAEIAKSSPPGILALLGCLEKDASGRLFNACALISSGKIKAYCRKIELPNYGVFDEKRYFHPGNDPFVFRINGLTAGVNICEDVWLDRVSEAQAEAGAKIIFNISSSPFHMGKSAERLEIIGRKARKLGVAITYNNSFGGQDELVFDGGSFIVDSRGSEIASAMRFGESMLIQDVELETGAPPAGHVLSITAKNAKKTITAPCATPRKLSAAEETYKALVLGTRDYALKNGFNKAVIGISGGIDSALTASIAVDAIGSNNIIGVLMPSRFSSKETVEDSYELAKLLKIKLLNIPIEPVFRACLSSLEEQFSGTEKGLAEENLQARIRGNLLMSLSNKFGWLVLTTGNKSELSCGYCTLYGDMAGGFGVLKDIYKTSVYKLSEFRNSVSPAIPKTIIKKEPTAELRHNQLDRDSLPPYELLDAILHEYIENNKNFRQLNRTGKFDHDTLKKVILMVDLSEYKRRQSPPGIKITPRAFGRDRRMPITNRYRQ